MAVTLKTADLHIGYRAGNKAKPVAGPLNTVLKKGKMACIMGANGIGKSTFIKTVSGLLEPLSGAVEVSNLNIHQLTNQERAKLLAVVLTGRPASQFVTVRNLIELGRYPHTNWQNALTTADQQAVEQAINAIGLTADANTPVAELSDGNAQKAIIGRALAQEAGIIILDEPTVHLDIANKHMIMTLLQQLCQQQGISILISTHDLQLALDFAHQLWLFDDNGITTGLTEDLILNGCLERLFGHQPAAGTTAVNVAIEGDKKAVALLHRAIGKTGLPADSLPGKIYIQRHHSGIRIEAAGQTYTSMAAFINHLANNRP